MGTAMRNRGRITWDNHQRGLSLFEVGLTVAVLTLLALVAVPSYQISSRRLKEVELRHDLRMMRRAIDEYHRYAMQGLITQTDVSQDFYPPDLETLVEGVELAGDPTGKKIRFLRRIPVDPMTGETEWNFLSTRDDWDSSMWGGENVFDVGSKSEATSLDGKSHYNEW
jgi:general secretion pathway protein G